MGHRAILLGVRRADGPDANNSRDKKRQAEPLTVGPAARPRVCSGAHASAVWPDASLSR